MEQRHNSPSNSMQLVPYAHRHLAVVPPPITAAARFNVPRGWGVEEVPRPDGSRSDTYYYEPGSGRKFRSIKEIHRYLNGEPFRRRRSTRNLSLHNNHNYNLRRMTVSGGKNYELRRITGGKLWRSHNEVNVNHLAIVATDKAAPTTPFSLPDGWIVEEVPRRYSPGWIDKYYYEPESGQKFRSLVAVERYLEENAPLSKALEEIKENKPLAKFFKLENHTKKSTPRKEEYISEENTEASSFISPPMRVDWVLASPQGDAWNPFISEMLVPDAVKQQWTDRFLLYMNDEISNQSNGA